MLVKHPPQENTLPLARACSSSAGAFLLVHVLCLLFCISQIDRSLRSKDISEISPDLRIVLAYIY